MIATWSDLNTLALGLTLPEVTLAHPWGHEILKAHGKMRRYWAARVDGAPFKANPDEREMLLQADPDTFFLHPHYTPHGLILARAGRTDEGWAKARLISQWRAAAQANGQRDFQNDVEALIDPPDLTAALAQTCTTEFWASQPPLHSLRCVGMDQDRENTRNPGQTNQRLHQQHRPRPAPQPSLPPNHFSSPNIPGEGPNGPWGQRPHPRGGGEARRRGKWLAAARRSMLMAHAFAETPRFRQRLCIKVVIPAPGPRGAKKNVLSLPQGQSEICDPIATKSAFLRQSLVPRLIDRSKPIIQKWTVKSLILQRRDMS